MARAKGATSIKYYAGAQFIHKMLRNLWYTVFKWNGLPATISQKFLMKNLLEFGEVAFFKQKETNEYMVLPFTMRGSFNVYGEYNFITVYSAFTGYRETLKVGRDCIIIYAHYEKLNVNGRLRDYANRIFRMERTEDLNIHAQKTPFVAMGSKDQRLSLKKYFNQVEDFETVILLNEVSDLAETFRTEETVAPFVADKIIEVEKKVWNNALSFIGIENNFGEKKERLTENEAMISNGLANGQRNVKMQSLDESLERINAKYDDLEISVEIANEIITDLFGANTVSEQPVVATKPTEVTE
jgi:hypothetical protein